MNVAICDDDQNTRNAYREFVEHLGREWGEEYSVLTFSTGDSLILQVESDVKVPVIIFLDAIMPGQDSIEIARRLRNSGYEHSIVFMAGSRRHAVEAFDLEAVDYVLKGAADEPDRFARALRKATDREKRHVGKRVALSGQVDTRSFLADDIVYFQTDRHTCIAHFENGRVFPFSSTLSVLQERLAPLGFQRVHRGYLANLNKISSYTYCRIVMNDGSEIPVGRTRFDELCRAMERLASVKVGDAEKE